MPATTTSRSSTKRRPEHSPAYGTAAQQRLRRGRLPTWRMTWLSEISIPRNRGNELTVRREEANSFLTLHREINRLFDDVFRGFDLSPFGTTGPFLDR